MTPGTTGAKLTAQRLPVRYAESVTIASERPTGRPRSLRSLQGEPCGERFYTELLRLCDLFDSGQETWHSCPRVRTGSPLLNTSFPSLSACTGTALVPAMAACPVSPSSGSVPAIEDSCELVKPGLSRLSSLMGAPCLGCTTGDVGLSSGDREWCPRH